MWKIEGRNLKSKEQYKDDKLHGKRTEYSDKGRVEYVYKNGKQVKKTRFDNNGNVLK